VTAVRWLLFLASRLAVLAALRQRRPANRGIVAGAIVALPTPTFVAG
jgi:ABC-type dipeptide/oligopeptide/nickel transport system permease component